MDASMRNNEAAVICNSCAATSEIYILGCSERHLLCGPCLSNSLKVKKTSARTTKVLCCPLCGCEGMDFTRKYSGSGRVYDVNASRARRAALKKEGSSILLPNAEAAAQQVAPGVSPRRHREEGSILPSRTAQAASQHGAPRVGPHRTEQLLFSAGLLFPGGSTVHLQTAQAAAPRTAPAVGPSSPGERCTGTRTTCDDTSISSTGASSLYFSTSPFERWRHPIRTDLLQMIIAIAAEFPYITLRPPRLLSECIPDCGVD
eukprot:TRINITY_DN3426_c0_g1_i1.p1 TRINITY_DN3426_c0_g1~~TRINITY_DN3426_c0_g1_i1.p1  ORF type:complete len:260 (+),score=12.11 TRINITY_DN3426_c0_g1_i1:145-924(+)